VWIGLVVLLLARSAEAQLGDLAKAEAERRKDLPTAEKDIYEREFGEDDSAGTIDRSDRQNRPSHRLCPARNGRSTSR
jgi:hypothetical protein